MGMFSLGGEIFAIGERRELVKLVSSVGKRGRDPGQKWKDQLPREKHSNTAFLACSERGGD